MAGSMMARFRGSALLLGLALVPAAAAARNAADPTITLSFDGLTRSYLLHVPAVLPSGAVPVVLAFHGGGGQGSGMAALTGLDALADQDGFIAAYPNGVDRHWNDGRATIKNKTDDVGFVAAILDGLEQRYPVDPGRVYATGISNGAMFSERLACQLSDRIAAVAPVAGTLPADLAPGCRPSRPVAILQIGGTEDPIMPYEGGAVADFGGRGEGGVVLSDPRTVAIWQGLDTCPAAAPTVILPPIAPPDGTSVQQSRAAPCAGGTSVILLTILGGGHTWPDCMQYAPRFIIGRVSHQLDASQAIVNFFLSQPARPAAR